MTAGLTESVMNIVFMRIFGSGDGRHDFTGGADRRLLGTVVSLRVLNAISTLLVIGVATPSVPLLFLWAVTSRVGICSFTFWRVSAQCWLVDEDCALRQGAERREGTIFGALAMVQNFAGAAFSSAAFLGLGLAGLRTENCASRCANEGSDGEVSLEADGGKDCVDRCFRGVIDMQPASLIFYVRLVIGVWAPLCELLVAWHSYRFPIKGARLRRIYNRVSESRGEDSKTSMSSPSLARLQHIGGCPRAQAHHASSSKIVLQLEDPGAEAFLQAPWLARLAHTTALVENWQGPKSLTVLFDVLEAEQYKQASSANYGRLAQGACMEPSKRTLDAAPLPSAEPQADALVEEQAVTVQVMRKLVTPSCCFGML